MAFKHHLVAVPAPSWGHARPMAPLCFKMIKERPDILVTIPVIGQYKAKMDKEMARYFAGSDSSLKDQIRIVQISDFDGGEFQYWDLIMRLFPSFFEKLCAGSESIITCCTGQTYPGGAPKPDVCIIDGTLSHPLGTSLIIDAKKANLNLKVFFWSVPGLSTILSILGPPDLGGISYLEQEAKELAEKTNISIREAMVKLFVNPSGRVRNVAGLPSVYDYEFLGEYIIPGGEERWIDLSKQMLEFLTSCDGLVTVSSPIIEGETIKATKQWLGNMGKSCFALGPLMPLDAVDLRLGDEESSRGKEVFEFLDRVYETHGEHSVLYMSFGTSVFPDGETVWQLIDIILDMKRPLIFAMPHADTYETKLPNDVRTRLESSELALVAKWTPQQTILIHPAVGAFFTHGGQGSLTESLVAGVPMIIWPLQADQPCNCLNLTLNLKVAYQLLEVRINHGRRPLYRGYSPKGTKEAIDAEFRRVLNDSFGEDGESKRMIARGLSKRLKEAWREGGEALFEMRQMLQDYFS